MPSLRRKGAKQFRRWRWTIGYWLSPRTPPQPPIIRRRRAWAALIMTPFGVMPFFGLLGGAMFLLTWIAVSGLLLFSIIMVFVVLGNRLRRRVISSDCRLCIECGYDLRGSPPQGRCPECGSGYDIVQVEAAWREHLWQA